MLAGELNIPVSRLKGVGPAVQADLAKLGILHISHLIFHFPRDWENRRDEVTLRESLASAVAGNRRPAHTLVRITGHSYFGHGPRKTLKLHIVDRQGTEAEIPCFNRPFLEKKFPVGTDHRLFGLTEARFQTIQVTSFDLEPLESGQHFGEPLGAGSGALVPQYPLAGNLTQGLVQKLVRQAFHDYVPSLDEELPPGLRDRVGGLGLREALWSLHFPETPELLEKARSALAYRELFHLQTAVFRRSWGQRTGARPAQKLPRELRKEFLARLPFPLTADQEKVIAEIDADLESPQPMARLLQGDVGSGKTLVAFLSALPLIQAGFQCALMAPTELLALQHAENAARLLDPVGVRVAFLSGNLRSAGRSLLLQELAEGRIDYVVGTHALFSSDVVFKNLRYVVIDEQHRFGVAQRQALLQKGANGTESVPDLLMMSATPIPRTLALTAFGDLKTSVIKTMPVGRKPIITHTARMGNQHKAYEFVRHELKAGHRAYFVYPLIETSEALDLKDTQTMADHLARDVYPEFQVGLIHSRLDEEEKKTVMGRFSRGEVQILVATSVVEVGVDVAEATCMVIEHAERFGLSALHQLRGRVGRSSLQSYCFLVFSENLTEDGKTRVKVMMENSDGFAIAEEDLKLRGPGDMTGMRQSGYLRLKVADLSRDLKVLIQARDDVRAVLESDPQFLDPENTGLRRLWEKAPPFNADLVAL